MQKLTLKAILYYLLFFQNTYLSLPFTNLKISNFKLNYNIYDNNSSKTIPSYLNNKLTNQFNYDKILNIYDTLMNSNIKESISSNLKYLIELIPEIEYMIDFDHKHPHHHLDVWEHTLYALSLSEKDFDLRLSLLLPDIGKPFSFNEKNGIRHYPNHPYISAEMTKTILTRLGFNNEYINKIYYLIKYHDTPITKKDINNNYELTLIRYSMQKCDALAHHPEKLERRKKYLESTKKLILKTIYFNIFLTIFHNINTNFLLLILCYIFYLIFYYNSC